MSDVRISLGASGGFVLHVPSTVNGDHEVLVPATMSGLSIIRKVLSARVKDEDKRIGNTSSPIQFQVEAWLAEDRRVRAKETAEAAKAKVEKEFVSTISLAGINIEELDI